MSKVGRIELGRANLSSSMGEGGVQFSIFGQSEEEKLLVCSGLVCRQRMAVQKTEFVVFRKGA